MSGATAPVAGDTVTIDNLSNNANLIVNVASNCTSIVVTGTHTGNLAVNASLTVAGTVTFVSTMTLTASATNNFLFLSIASTLTSGGLTWPGSIRFGGGSGVIFTLADSWTVAGSVQVNGNNTVTQTVNGNTLTINGGLQCGVGFLNVLAGTTNIIMNGTGTLSCLNNSVVRSNLEINTSGTITFAVSFIYNTGILKYTAGTIVHGASSILGLGGSGTFTINAPITLNQINVGNFTFNGTAGFSIQDLLMLTAGVTVTWKDGITYTVNDMITITGTFASPIVFVSVTPGSQYFIIYPNNSKPYSNIDVGFVNATDVNSNGGMTINDFKGTLSNTANWNAPINAVPQGHSAILN